MTVTTPNPRTPRRGQTGPTPRLAVLVSGSGRSLANLIRLHRQDSLAARPALVVASRPCKALDIAREAGVHAELIPSFQSPGQLETLLGRHRIDLVALAGYLKHLPVPQSFNGRILNIHPALLPKHGGPGMFGQRVHRAVLDAKDAESGCTVHEVTDVYDAGPIVAQARCPVLETDTPATLAARVFELEKDLYPRVINQRAGTLSR